MGNFLKTEMSQECVPSESRIIQFRSEFYNMFNHTQFSAVDSTARFDPAGSQVNTRLGQVYRGAFRPRDSIRLEF